MANLSNATGEDLDPHRISAAGQIYQTMVGDLLTAEFDRRKALEGRGATIVTSSASMLTLIFGLTILITGKDHVFTDHCAIWFLDAALVAFALSAIIAIFVQTYLFRYTVISSESLRSLPRDNTEWARLADDATRSWLTRQVNTVCSLRRGNNAKARLVTASLVFQVAAIVLLAVSVGLDLHARSLTHPGG